MPKGTLVVDAAATINIEIPVFCSHPKLDPVGCCRMCMVEFESPRGVMLNTACTVPVAEGMIVRTNTEQVQTVQQANLGFILLNHPLDCPICDKGGECPLQDQTMRYGNPLSQMVEPKRLKKKHYPISDTIMLDQERCVVCWRCTRYLEEWEDKPQLGLFERGGKTIIDIQPGQEVDAKTSGNIIDICPVGALTNRVSRFAFRPWETERTASICTHCSMGCNLRLDSRTDTLRRIVGRENMAVNDQWICDKGRFAHAWVNHDERLSQPLVRKNGQLVPVTWQEALTAAAAGLKAAKSHPRRGRHRRHRQRQAGQREQLYFPALHAPDHRHQQHRPPQRRRHHRPGPGHDRPGRRDEAPIRSRPRGGRRSSSWASTPAKRSPCWTCT